MAVALDRRERLRRVGDYGRKGMIGDITELSAWNMACLAGTLLRNWDEGVFAYHDKNGDYWYSRRRDDSWTESNKIVPGVQLKRSKRLWNLRTYPVDGMDGFFAELTMWDRACRANVKCSQWDQGAFTLIEEGFKNRYERLPDGSWSNTRTVSIKGSW